MLAIFISTILGILLTLLATQNTQNVTIHVFDFALTLPIFIIGAITFLAGIFLALLFTLFDTTATAITLHSKDNKIREYYKTNENLQKHLANLQARNQRLEQQVHELNQRIRDNKIQGVKDSIKSFFGRVRHGFS